MPDDYVWTPTRDYIDRSRVRQFMESRGIGSFAELVHRSTSDVAWFWDAMVADLGLTFFRPYDRVLDDSRGIAWSRWFVGGTTNLAYNCLDRHVAAGRGGHTAVVWQGEDGAGRTLSYQELLDETARLAASLKRLGLGVGDRIGVFLPMIPESVAALMACARIGAIAIPIFSGFAAHAVAARLQDGAATALITADATLRRGEAVPLKQVADEAAAASPTLRHMIVVRRLGREVAWSAGRDQWWHELISEAPGSCPAEELDSETPWMLGYTSGTTGQPKGAVHVHGGFLVKIAQEARHQVDLHDDDRLCWVSDMGWIMGPWQVVGALANGSTVVLFEGAPDYPGPDRLWRLVAEQGITVLGVSPTLVRALMRHGEGPVRAHDLSGLRVLASTGEPWNPDPWLWLFHHVGGGTRPIINFSGGTEVGACFLSPHTLCPLKPCTLGGPSLGMAVDVFDEAGRPLRGGVGELVCTRPWPGMTRGIWNDPERYLRSYWSRWPGVWTHGDWASIDADGLWFLHGRSDDTIKVAGKRIGPAEIESAAVAHPAVAEAAAVAVPHAIKGEAIWCFVVLAPGAVASDALAVEIRERVAAELGRPFAPDQVRFVRDLPRTRSNKILRRAIRARLLDHDPGDLSSLENPSALDEVPRGLA
jgi:acetyl-CoA synthetase